jgi:hypothetical protein
MSGSSSCGEHEFDPMGRAGIGVMQTMTGRDYPFVKPSADIRYLIADLSFSYEDPSDYTNVTPYELPLSVAWLYGLGCEPADKPLWAPDPENAAEIILKDAAGETVFDSTIADYTTTEWGNYRIHDWRTETAVLRLVEYVAWPPSGAPEPRDYAEHIEPENGILDARAIQRIPKRVKSLRVVLDQFTGTNVDMVGGYNVDLTPTVPTPDVGGRNVTQITIDGSPGGGDGIFPGCVEADLFIRSINGIRPNQTGDFLMAATDCYWIRQPTSVVNLSPMTVRPTIELDENSGHLQLGNDCGPCCSCDDYVDTVRYLNRTWLEGKRLGAIFESSRSTYHDNRERWNEAKECLEKRPLRLNMVAQACPFLDVVAQYCNQTDDCVKDVTLVIRFRTTPEILPNGTDEEGEEPDMTDPVPDKPDDINEAVKVVCGYTTIKTNDGTAKYTLDGSWSEYRAYFDAINPFASVFVKFRLEFPNDGRAVPVGGVTTTPYAVEGQLMAAVGDKWLSVPPDNPTQVAVDRQSTTLECPSSDPPNC